MVKGKEVRVFKSKPAVLKAMRKYVHSERYKQVRGNYFAAKRDSIRDYNCAYQKAYRDRVKRFGICQTCKRRPVKVKHVLDDSGRWVLKKLTICEFCSKRSNERGKFYRLAKKGLEVVR